MKQLYSVANSRRHDRNLNKLISAMREGERLNQFNSCDMWEFSPLELEVAKEWGILLRQDFRMTYACYIPTAWHIRYAKEVAYEYGKEDMIEVPNWVPQRPISAILTSLGIEWFTRDDFDDVPVNELIEYGYYIKHEENYWLSVTGLYDISEDDNKMECVNKFFTGLGYKGDTKYEH